MRREVTRRIHESIDPGVLLDAKHQLTEN